MKSPDVLINETNGEIYDCPACVPRKHKLHPSHTRNGEPPLPCKYYQHEPGQWSCETCLRVRPASDPAHTYEDGCRFADGGLEFARRRKKELGERAKAGPARHPAIPAGGKRTLNQSLMII